MITLTAKQLREVLEFINPDGEADAAQLETSVTIEYAENIKYENGDNRPSGTYAWLTEYPEEGAIGPLEFGE
jgi:hypothetical protein